MYPTNYGRNFPKILSDNSLDEDKYPYIPGEYPFDPNPPYGRNISSYGAQRHRPTNIPNNPRMPPRRTQFADEESFYYNYGPMENMGMSPPKGQTQQQWQHRIHQDRRIPSLDPYEETCSCMQHRDFPGHTGARKGGGGPSGGGPGGGGGLGGFPYIPDPLSEDFDEMPRDPLMRGPSGIPQIPSYRPGSRAGTPFDPRSPPFSSSFPDEPSGFPQVCSCPNTSSGQRPGFSQICSCPNMPYGPSGFQQNCPCSNMPPGPTVCRCQQTCTNLSPAPNVPNFGINTFPIVPVPIIINQQPQQQPQQQLQQQTQQQTQQQPQKQPTTHVTCIQLSLCGRCKKENEITNGATEMHTIKSTTETPTIEYTKVESDKNDQMTVKKVTYVPASVETNEAQSNQPNPNITTMEVCSPS